MKKYFLLFILIALLFPVEIANSQGFFPVSPTITFNYRGTWAVGTSYTAGDAIRSPSNGYLYVATASITGGADPGSTTTPPAPWSFGIAQPVERGPRGETGIDGNDLKAVFYENNAQPTVIGASYDGTTFTPPTGSTANFPPNPTQTVWIQLYELRNDTNPPRLDSLGLHQFSGPRGPPGQDGQDGQDGATGLQGIQGVAGQDGTDGTNGTSSIEIYRKTLAVELLEADRPTVTYDGSGLSNLDLPDTDSDAWQRQPYSSRINSNWDLHANNTSPQDIDIDTSVQPNVVYVLDDLPQGIYGGYVYRYSVTGTYIDRWGLNIGNDTAEALDVSGSVVRVLDTSDFDRQGITYNQVFVYNKADGGRQTNLEFRIPRPSSALLKGITVQGSSIYIVTDTAIRRFNLTTRMEETTGILSSFGTGSTDNVDPEGSDANAYYFLTVDPTRRKVFVRDINTLTLRHMFREFPLGSDNGSPKGIAINETSIFILNTVDDKVYRYYNPDNILWASELTISNNAPYTVTATIPYDKTGQRGEGGITVQGTGVGRDGHGVTTLYQEVATGSATPNAPAGGTASSYNFTVLPENWHKTEAAAKAAFGPTGDVYISVIVFDQPNRVLRYGDPLKITGDTGPQGPQGIPGSTSAAGDSWTIIWQNAASEPALPTQGTSTNGVYNPPSDLAGWSQSAPTSVPDGQTTYFSFVRLPGAGGNVTYLHPQQVPRGEKGDTGDKGDPGDRGPAGLTGVGFRMIFQEATNQPNLPTGGTWDGRTFRTPSGWSENNPTRTVNDPENLYATGVELPSDPTNPIHYTGVFQLNGPKGDQGIQGIQGTRGDSYELIFNVGTTQPSSPSSGSGTWNAATNSYTPPTDWQLDATGFTGAQNLYATKVKLPGASNIETYGSVWIASGARGAVGPRGPPGPAGGTTGSGEDGDSTTVIYKVSATSQDNSIIGQRPTGGSWDHVTNMFTPPSDYLTDIPDPLNNRFVYMSVATLSGESNTISYDLPLQMNLRGPQGTPGTPGATGAQGPSGSDSGYIYTRSTSKPSPPAAGTGQFISRTAQLPETINVVGWSADPESSAIGTGLLWAVNWSYNPDATVRILYGNVIQSEGPAGQRGPAGPMGTPGTGSGTDGSSVNVMFQASSSTLRSIPTGGTWVRATNIFTPPSGWYTTYDAAEAAGNTGDVVYYSFVYLSGTSDTVDGYSRPIRSDGERGPIGPRGERGAAGPQGIQGERGIPGPSGQNGKFPILLFQRASSRPNQPTGLSYSGGAILGAAAQGWLREAPDPTDTQPVWQALVDVNPNTGDATVVTVSQWTGNRGPAGADGPQGPEGPQGEAGRDGVPGVSTTIEMVKFGILPDTTDRILRSSRSGPNELLWDPWGRGGQNEGRSGIQEVRGNFTGVGNPNIATQRYTIVLNDASLTGGSISSGFTAIPRNPQTYRPLRIIPSSDAAVQSGQTASVTIHGGLRSATEIGTGNQFSRPFRLNTVTFEFDVVNGVVQTLVTPIEFADFQQISFTNFTAGTADIEFAEGIRIEEDGVYSLELQLDTMISGTANPGELIITLYVEDEDGNEAGSYINQSHDFAGVISEGVTFPDYFPVSPTDFNEGDHIYFVYNYVSGRGNQDNVTNDRFTIRVNNHPAVDDRLIVRKHIQSGGGTGGGTEGPPGESIEAIWVRSATVPVTPRASDLSVNENGRFTSLTSMGITWDDEPPTSGAGINYKQYLGIRQTTIRIIGTPVPDQGPQGIQGPTGPQGIQGNPGTAGTNGTDGNDGRNGIGQQAIYWRASSAPSLGLPSNSGITQTNGVLNNAPTGWSLTIPNNNNRLYKSDAQITPTGNITFSTPYPATGDAGASGTAGTNADITIEIFQRNTNETPSTPSLLGTWNGTDYDPPSGWFEQPQTSTTTQYIVSQRLRLTGNAPYTITAIGPPLLIALRLPTAPPVTPSRNTYRLTWGLANDSNNPVGTAVQSDPFQLAVGETHSTPERDMPVTTTIGDNYYVTLPSGLTLTAVTDSLEGNIIDEWTRVGSTQTWVYTIGEANNVNTMGFTVRRDN